VSFGARGLRIRRYEPTDHDAVWALHNGALDDVGAHAGNGPWDDDLHEIEAVYLRDGDFLVGDVERCVVAMGAVRRSTPSRAEVKRMRVAPEFQGRGYGRAILLRLEERARALGCETLHLDTTAGQVVAQALYRSHGFREVGRGRHGDFELLLFEKHLGPDGRHLDWDGCFNARDLGGLQVGDRATRWGALVRSDALDALSPAGWEALWDHGIRTIIDLRNEDERGPDNALRPDGLTTLHLPLDVSEDREFWNVWASGPQFGTPLYYGPHLERFPERSVAVLKAMASAPAGGVLYHCGSGRDRVGQITMLVLHLLGAAPDVIAADYELSAARLSRGFAARGEPDQALELTTFLSERGTTAGEVITSLLGIGDIPRLLIGAGLSQQDVAALRRRAVV
jgi:ribosomal protein S18 acetylase RimI-like enzyme